MNALPTPVLSVNGLTAGYVPGIDIVRDAAIEVPAGSLTCILGPNGAGKSTLLKAVFGLVPVRSGSILLGSTDLTGTKPSERVRLGVGYVPQSDDVFADLTVEDNLKMGAITAKATYVERRDRVYGWFEVLATKRHARAGALSGGQRRLLGIGRALMTAPDLLLLDEPSAGLSPANVGEVFSRIRKIRDDGVAIAMVEQNAVEGLAIADTGYILDQGKEQVHGPADSVLSDPRVRELYLGLAGEVG